jgi:catechol 2,3-dioxygenase-like lactoylglutathione lyase family enzyme
MPITHLFAGVAVSDFAAAYDWYERLFARAADMFPCEGEAVWRVTPVASIYVTVDPERAGGGLLTIAVSDLDAHAQGLGTDGVAIAESSEGPPRRLSVRDGDGNTITFFEDPALAQQ